MSFSVQPDGQVVVVVVGVGWLEAGGGCWWMVICLKATFLSSQHLLVGVLDTVGCFVCQYKHTATCVNESIVNLWRGQAELYEWGGELLSPLQPIYATHIG